VDKVQHRVIQKLECVPHICRADLSQYSGGCYSDMANAVDTQAPRCTCETNGNDKRALVSLQCNAGANVAIARQAAAKHVSTCVSKCKRAKASDSRMRLSSWRTVIGYERSDMLPLLAAKEKVS
jgi:hypothetical protein